MLFNCFRLATNKWNTQSDCDCAYCEMCTVCGVHDLEPTLVFMCELHRIQMIAFHWVKQNHDTFICWLDVWCLNRPKTQGNFYNHSLIEPLCDVDDAMLGPVLLPPQLQSSFIAHRSSCITHAKNNNRKFSDLVLTHTYSNSHCFGMVSVRCKHRSADIFAQKLNWISQYLAFFSLSLAPPFELYCNFSYFFLIHALHLSIASICIRSANHAYHLYFVPHHIIESHHQPIT